MYGVFGDLHGDIDCLERFVEFVNGDKRFSYLFFTGDFFGLDFSFMPDGRREVLAERGRQYELIADLMNRVREGVELFVVPGNYDNELGNRFGKWDKHHKVFWVEGRKCFGHGGSHYAPTYIFVKIKNLERQVQEGDFLSQDRAGELQRLVKESPEIILSHSPVRKYVSHFLLNNQGRLVYFGGHTHVLSCLRVKGEANGREVQIIRPGALGRSMSKSERALPRGFVGIDINNLSEVKYFAVNNGGFEERAVVPQEISLKEYIESEGKWKIES